MSARASLPRRDRWYGSIQIRRDGRMSFSATTFRNLNHVAVWDSSPMRVCVLMGGHQVLYLWPERGRVVSACFDYLLSPELLRDAVSTLRGVTGGLASWIVPALEWTQADLGSVKNPKFARPELLAIIPELLDSCRDLPVADSWRRRRQQTQQAWAKHLRAHPEQITEIKAAWMLPDGYLTAHARTPRSRVRRP